jgi:hypothetical protein
MPDTITANQIHDPIWAPDKHEQARTAPRVIDEAGALVFNQSQYPMTDPTTAHRFEGHEMVRVTVTAWIESQPVLQIQGEPLDPVIVQLRAEEALQAQRVADQATADAEAQARKDLGALEAAELAQKDAQIAADAAEAALNSAAAEADQKAQEAAALLAQKKDDVQQANGEALNEIAKNEAPAADAKPAAKTSK